MSEFSRFDQEAPAEALRVLDRVKRRVEALSLPPSRFAVAVSADDTIGGYCVAVEELRAEVVGGEFDGAVLAFGSLWDVDRFFDLFDGRPSIRFQTGGRRHAGLALSGSMGGTPVRLSFPSAPSRASGPVRVDADGAILAG